LLTPDEILRFPNDELLIVLRGENVLRAKKFDYTRHPYAKELVRTTIFDYAPKPVQNVLKSPQTEPEIIPVSQTEHKTIAASKLFAAAKPPAEF
jgi:type IV secretion system protein VirD4